MTDWAEELSAIGTVGAFAVALTVLALQLRTSRREQDERRRTQARLVTAWFDQLRVVKDGDSAALEGRIQISNLSDEPVYDIALRLGDPYFQHLPYDGGVLHLPSLAGESVLYLPLLAPRADKFHNWSQRFDRDEFPDLASPIEVPLPPWALWLGMEFRDAGGRRWTRQPNGRLIEASS